MNTTSQRPQRNRQLTDKALAQINEKEEKLRRQEENRRRKEEKTQKAPKSSNHPPGDSELQVSRLIIDFHLLTIVVGREPCCSFTTCQSDNKELRGSTKQNPPRFIGK